MVLLLRMFLNTMSQFRIRCYVVTVKRRWNFFYNYGKQLKDGYSFTDEEYMGNMLLTYTTILPNNVQSVIGNINVSNRYEFNNNGKGQVRLVQRNWCRADSYYCMAEKECTDYTDIEIVQYCQTGKQL